MFSRTVTQHFRNCEQVMVKPMVDGEIRSKCLTPCSVERKYLIPMLEACRCMRDERGKAWSVVMSRGALKVVT